MKNFALVVITVSMLHSNPAFSEEACCVRDSATLPVTMPAGQLTDKSLLVTNAFDNILNVSEVRDCPLNLGITHYQGNLNLEQYVDAIGKAYGVQPDAKLKLVRSKMHGILTEYVFKGSISSTGEETTDDDGDLFGQFTMNMRLLDNCPSRAATSNVKTAEISWDGSNTTIAGEGGIIGRIGVAAIKQLSQSFMPIDDLIYDYERKPENCEIEPEKEKVKIGEAIDIDLQNIVDGKGRIAKSWQRLLVKAEHGEILNGKEQGEYRVFEVGNGSVKLRYQAPEDCPEEKIDIITVENTCENCPETNMNFIPAREIGRQQIQLICGGQLEVSHFTECSVPPAVSTQESTTGSTRFFIDDNNISGEGAVTIPLTGSGNYGGCIGVTNGTVELEIINGSLSTNGGVDPELDFSIRETHYQFSRTTVITCPDGQVSTISNPTTDVILDYELTLPFEDGHEQVETGTEGSCHYTNTFTLHVDN